MTSPAYVTATDLVRAGLTYRQVDHHATKGWLLPVDDANPGIGRARLYPYSELRVARVAVRLMDAGVEPGVAYRLARQLDADGRAELAPGVLVEVTG